MITPEQIRAARAMLKWSAQNLADAAKISIQTIQRMEKDNGTENILGRNILAAQKALEAAGIEFIPENGGGAGVRLRKNN